MALFAAMGISAAPTPDIPLADLMIIQLVDRVTAGDTKAAAKGKGVRKVVPSTLDLFAKPLYRLSIDAIEGLIEGAYKYMALLSKQFAKNWNQGYI